MIQKYNLFKKKHIWPAFFLWKHMYHEMWSVPSHAPPLRPYREHWLLVIEGEYSSSEPCWESMESEILQESCIWWRNYEGWWSVVIMEMPSSCCAQVHTSTKAKNYSRYYFWQCFSLVMCIHDATRSQRRQSTSIYHCCVSFSRLLNVFIVIWTLVSWWYP